MLENIISILSVTSAVVTILSVIVVWFKEKLKVLTWILLLIIFFGSTFLGNYAYKNSTKKTIIRNAQELIKYREYEYSNQGFVYASLSFLEANKNMFPDSYSRAQDLCKQFNCNAPEENLSDSYRMIDLSSAMEGIVKGIAIVSK